MIKMTNNDHTIKMDKMASSSPKMFERAKMAQKDKNKVAKNGLKFRRPNISVTVMLVFSGHPVPSTCLVSAPQTGCWRAPSAWARWRRRWSWWPRRRSFDCLTDLAPRLPQLLVAAGPHLGCGRDHLGVINIINIMHNLRS